MPSATLDRTIGAGGRFIPVLEPRRSREDVLVLVDIEKGDHPWLGGFTRVLDAWRSQGVNLVRYSFRFNPSTLEEQDTRESIRVDELARRTEGLPCILFSRRLSWEGMKGTASWVSQLEAWPRRVWIDPEPRHVSELHQERRRTVQRLEAVRLPRFGLSAEGVMNAVRWLATEGDAQNRSAERRVPTLPPRGSPLDEALRKWALAAALVPDPVWDQLETIRLRFRELSQQLPDPRYLQLLLEWVERDTGRLPELEGGRGLAILGEAEDRWRCEQRRRAARTGDDFEQRVCELLWDQLESTEPEGELQRAFWRFKRSMHRAILEPERALELLGWVYDSPIRWEAGRWIQREVARQDKVPGPRFPRAAKDTFIAFGDGDGDGGSGAGLGQIFLGLGKTWLQAGTVALIAASLLTWAASEARRYTGARRVLPATFALGDPVDSEDLPEMVRIEGGSFQMGGTKFSDEQPIRAVAVGSFELSRSEVTVAQYTACVSAGGCDEPEAGGSCNWGVADRETHPVNCVSWEQARDYADWAGMRLPSEAEWEFAARSGRDEVEYPWGNEQPNCELAVVFGCGDGTQPVCTHPLGNTAKGICDMAANVYEWVEDDWHDDYRNAPGEARAWVDSPRGE